MHREAGDGTEKECIKEGCLTLVDLVGSDAVWKNDATGEGLNEGKHIDKGLLALRNCIADVRNGKKRVPFRNSTLTKVLR